MVGSETDANARLKLEPRTAILHWGGMERKGHPADLSSYYQQPRERASDSGTRGAEGNTIPTSPSSRDFSLTPADLRQCPHAPGDASLGKNGRTGPEGPRGLALSPLWQCLRNLLGGPAERDRDTPNPQARRISLLAHPLPLSPPQAPPPFSYGKFDQYLFFTRQPRDRQFNQPNNERRLFCH